ncbi:uncharacterized protein LOC133302213 [Gastrolobium bilobum]|uniref:uncharacterized protein LOC133302213 n=1 Tax=Gastrolobium bilobum TaxID=150636 RepID=UPI002AB0C2E9|nr:uncharacterized protein LOC133302213 [Gastrolobium bilobum]
MKANQELLQPFVTEMKAKRNAQRRDDSPPHTATMTPTPTPTPVMTPQQGESEASHHTGDASQHTVVVDHFGEADAEERRMISFQKHKPPSFLGSKDPKVVNTWLQGMEKIFQVMRCQDPQRLRYSIYMLEEYFPRDAREAKQGKFDRLVQGTMSVDAYVVKFNELVKFANYGKVLPTPDFLAAKFQRGLNEKIAKRMSNTAVQSFVDLVTQCKRVETVYRRYPKSDASCEQEVKRNANPFDSPWKGACFKCGQTGHFARNYTFSAGQAANLQALPISATTTDVIPTIGRIYTTNVQHSYKAPNLVKGIIFIANHDLSVLFDSGATHSFIAEYVAMGLNLNVTKIDSPMHITTATGKALKAGNLGYVLLGCLVGEKEVEISNIPVVKEFMEVLPDGIPEFPP